MGASLSIGITQGTQDIANNRTYVTATVYVTATGSTWNGYDSQCTGSIWGSLSGSWSKGFAKGTTTTLYSVGGWVTHASDGTCTVSFGASYNTAVSAGTISASASKTLTTIPRVSDLSINKTSVPADGSTTVTATATKKASSFTDVLTVDLGDYSKTITSGTAFTIPMTWINAISGTSAEAKVTVTTKSGSTVIGSKSVSLTITVPSSVTPTISSITVSEAVSAVTTAFGSVYCKNLSQLNIQVNASGIYGSTIRSYSTVIDEVTYVSQAFTSNVLRTSGTLTIKATVTDSRGRSKTLSKTITVIDYFAPIITSMQYYYCNSDGTQNSAGKYTKIVIGYSYASVNSKNTRTLTLKYKKLSATSYTSKTLTASAWTGTVETIIANTDPSITYEYIAIPADKIGASEGYKISTGVPVLSMLAGGNGATLFGEAEEEGFVVKGSKPAKFTGDIYIELDDETIALWEEVFGTSGGGS